MYNEIINTIIQKSSTSLSWLSQGLIYFIRAGSHAYGTNIESSDEDFRGLFIPPKSYFFSPSLKIEQCELKDPDTVVYNLQKFFNLLMQCNPNCIETLWVDEEDQLFISPIAELLLNNRDKFLSKKARFTFQGYSYSQWNRLKLHRNYLLNPPKSPPSRKELGLPEHTLIPKDQLLAVESAIKKELDKFNFDFLDGLTEDQKIGLREVMTEMLTRLKISIDDMYDGAAKSIGLNDNLIEIMKKEREYESKKRNWDQYQNWKKTRNPKRALLEEKYGIDCKNALHVVRLGLMCQEILESGKVIVKRPDRELLISIRNGAWTYEMVEEFLKKQDDICDTLYKNSTAIPHSPDKSWLDNFCIELIENGLSVYGKLK